MNERDIFAAAIQIEDSQIREAFLQAICAGDASLQRRIDSLLAVHNHPSPGLDRPLQTMQALAADFPDNGLPSELSPQDAAAVAVQLVDPLLGTHIGPYRILEKLGEGGMGVVYVAQQTAPIQRLVAMKVIAAGMDSHSVLRRFEAERQALAMMEHENIARVLDAGATGDGRPFFVMELVKGIPITRYCDEHQLDVARRLELFVEVCRAIQHAHHKGIIHRDIKPGNVLVAEYDGTATVKVIDFGVAKAIHDPVAEKSMFTQLGQMVGTLEYMSPEQARLNEIDVDTRSDVYSLGVLLYELLTGTTPFERQRLREAAFDEMLRIIREDDPPLPSEKLSTVDTLPSIAAKRNVEPARLNRLVRGELDWIVMKALEKDRNRRYDSAAAFAGDIENYLLDKTVIASPPSVGYRLTKFIRRHRGGVTVTIGVFVLLIASVAALWIERTHTLAAKADAEVHRESAIDQQTRAENNLRVARESLEEAYLQIGEQWHPADPESIRVREAFLKTALKFYRELSRGNTTDPALNYDRANALLRVGDLQAQLSQWNEAKNSYDAALALLEPIVAAEPDRWAPVSCLIRAHQSMSQIEYRLGNLEQARGKRQVALQVARVFHNRNPSHRDGILTWSRAERAVAYDWSAAGQREEAEPRVRDVVNGLNAARESLGDQAELLAEMAAAKGQLAELVRGSADPGAADALYRDQIKLRTAIAATDDAWPHRIALAITQCNYALYLNTQSQPDQATALFETASRTFTDAVEHLSELGVSDERAIGILLEGMNHFRSRQDAARATTIAQVASELAARSAAENRNDVKRQYLHAQTLQRLAQCCAEELRWTDAESAHQSAIQVFDRLRSQFPDSPDHVFQWAAALDGYALTLLKAKKTDEAFRQWVAAQRELQSAQTRFPQRFDLPGLLGQVMIKQAEQLLARQKKDEGTTIYRNALAALQASLQLGENNFAVIALYIDFHFRYLNLVEANGTETATTLDATRALIDRALAQFPNLSKFWEQSSALAVVEAGLAKQAGDTSAERNAWLRAIERQEKAVANYPGDNPLLQQALAARCLGHAWALQRMGDDAECLRQVVAAFAKGNCAWAQKWSCLLLLRQSIGDLKGSASGESAELVRQGTELGRSILAEAHQTAAQPMMAANVVWLLANVELPEWRDPAAARQLAETCLAQEQTVVDRASLTTGLAAALYREGDYEGCLSTIDELSKQPTVLSSRAELLRAMSQVQLGRTEEAKQTLEHAISILGATPSGDDQQIAEEAKNLIRGSELQ